MNAGENQEGKGARSLKQLIIKKLLSQFRNAFKSVQLPNQFQEAELMTNGEIQRDDTQPQLPSAPAIDAMTRPQKAQAQSAFLEIKQALTDRRAVPDPLPGWILPRVDPKALISEPTAEQLTQIQ